MIQKLLFEILKYLLFGGAGRYEEEAERLRSRSYVSFPSHKNLLNQVLSSETQILEGGVLESHMGLSGKGPKSVYVCETGTRNEKGQNLTDQEPGTHKPGISQVSIWRQVAGRSRVFRQRS